MSDQTHKVGDWAVIKGSWRPEKGQITKVSPKQIRTRRYSDRESHHSLQDIVFSGTEKQATDLVSVLIGLDARHDKARRDLSEQHRQRVAKAIANANKESTQ